MDVLRSLTSEQIRSPVTCAALRIDEVVFGSKTLSLRYAPFDHVNARARVVVVGLTPGSRQASDALSACQQALFRSESYDEALRKAKAFASFSGPMRRNLVAMLDEIGIPGLLGIGSTATLWDAHNDLIHFTSAIRYPVFVDAANWSGAPDILANTTLRGWFETHAPDEFRRLRGAVIVPLGKTVTRAMDALSRMGVISSEAVLAGLPHPSGANAERVACFLGRKSADEASPKTDAGALLRNKEALIRQVGSLRDAAQRQINADRAKGAA